MYKNNENPLKSSFSMTDMFYVSVLLSGREEIMPIEVSFEDIFYDLVSIRTEEPIGRNAELIINMFNDEVMYNISGQAVHVGKENSLYLTTIKIETLPTELFNELIHMMKEMIGEINGK